MRDRAPHQRLHCTWLVVVAAVIGGCADRGVGSDKDGTDTTDGQSDDPNEPDDGKGAEDAPYAEDGKDDGLPETCGDGVKDVGEACDINDLGGLSCVQLGFFAGELGCIDCNIDKSKCTAPPPGQEPDCGNGDKEPGEGCDGLDVGGLTCIDFGAEDGALSCTPDCQLVLEGCDKGKESENCGNGQLDPGETCDGDIAGVTCVDLGFAGGELSCDAAYCFLDTGKCE